MGMRCAGHYCSFDRGGASENNVKKIVLRSFYLDSQPRDTCTRRGVGGGGGGRKASASLQPRASRGWTLAGVGAGERGGGRFVCPINHADLFTERISGLAVFACGASRSIAIAGNY